jgi:hypothetical protein
MLKGEHNNSFKIIIANMLFLDNDRDEHISWLLKKLNGSLVEAPK